MIDAEAPARETLLTPAPIAFEGEQLSPSPFHYLFTGEDALEIASYNAVAGVRVAVQGRMWDPTEGIRPFAFTHVPSTDRSRTLERFGIANGYLLNVVVFASNGSPSGGQTFVSLHVIRGQNQARYLLSTLLQGYITSEQELAYPGSPIQHSLAAPGGYYRTITGTDPPAGTEIIETVPTGARWQLLAASAVLAPSGVAGTRYPKVIVAPGGVEVVRCGMQFGTTASSTVLYSWGAGMPASADFQDAHAGALPVDLVLNAGDSFKINHTNFDAGDNWGAPTYQVREWLEAQ